MPWIRAHTCSTVPITQQPYSAPWASLLTGVTCVSPGDAVLGIAPGCLGPAVHVPAGLVVRKPAALSFEAACTAPTVFCTVHAAFNDFIDLGSGSKVGRPDREGMAFAAADTAAWLTTLGSP
jgi:hypothetical protein